MGSANLNDRSQIGDHDSEIALVVEDGDQLEAAMDGKKVSAPFSASCSFLRIQKIGANILLITSSWSLALLQLFAGHSIVSISGQLRRDDQEGAVN